MNELEQNMVTDRINTWTKCRGIKQGWQFNLPESVRASFTEEVTLKEKYMDQGSCSRLNNGPQNYLGSTLLELVTVTLYDKRDLQM